MNSHTNDTTAVSPVLAVILVIGVTVILSAAIGVIVLDIGQSQTSTNSQSNSAFSISDENGEVRIQSQTGTAERVKILVDGEVETSEENISPGDVITLDDISEDAVITVVEVVGDSESVRETHTVTDGASEEVVEFSEPSDSAPSDVSMVSFAGGNGTESNPYVIMNDQQLQAMSADLGAHYVLEQNIDASGTREWNSGDGFEPIGEDGNRFTGSLEGNDYVIDGLYINRSSTNDVGLIGYFKDGDISNLGVTNADVTGKYDVGGLVGHNDDGIITSSYSMGSVGGDGQVGGLVGRNLIDSTVLDSYSTGNVSGSEFTVGGLVGYNNGGNITSSYSTGDVSASGNSVGGLLGYNFGGIVTSSYSTGSVSGTDLVGGLVGGVSSSGTVEYSYATGSVSGDDKVGGLVGQLASGTVEYSYSTGSVSGSSEVGGLIGDNNFGTVASSYWDTKSSNQNSGIASGSGNVSGLSTSDMQGDLYDTGFETDIVDTPEFTGVTGEYPDLAWESE